MLANKAIRDMVGTIFILTRIVQLGTKAIVNSAIKNKNQSQIANLIIGLALQAVDSRPQRRRSNISQHHYALTNRPSIKQIY